MLNTDSQLLEAVCQFRQSGLPQLVTLGHTLHSWRTEIAAMWRHTRNNDFVDGWGFGVCPVVGVEPEPVKPVDGKGNGRGERIRTSDLLVPNQAL